VLLLSAVVIAALAALMVRQIRSARLLGIMALTDELTTLPNRRNLLTMGERQAREAAAGGPPFGVLALDIDHFKRINDTLGHEAGDQVLRGVAAAVRGSLRGNDQVGRTGGEEFIAVLPGASLEAAAEVAERLRAAVERIAFPGLPELRVTVSVGVAVWDPADSDFAATTRRADASLYRAKEAGRNRVERASAAVH
jgi:diguanylate cyclase (GGDEF)-like protein